MPSAGLRLITGTVERVEVLLRIICPPLTSNVDELNELLVNGI